MSYATARNGENSDINKLQPEDRSVHEWYRFVLSFPPHLVRNYLLEFASNDRACILDPFCGTGTVLVECKKAGIQSIGIEANPMAYFASSVKVDWSPHPDGLMEHARYVHNLAVEKLETEGIEDNPLFEAAHIDTSRLRRLSPEREELLLTDSISPLPLHKALVLLECLEEHRNENFYRHELLALAKALVYTSSNLHFGPEVGVGKAKPDAPVLAPWLSGVHGIANDLRGVQEQRDTLADVYFADARQLENALAPKSVDVIITSPPYPNEKDYTRTTRLESVLLGFLKTKEDLRTFKRRLLRSNTRTIYKGDDDEVDIEGHPEIQRIAEEIEARRIALEKTSGFERLYATVTRRYFGGMARHLAQLRSILRPGAHLAYVVGDQASYLQVMISTGKYLAEIAEALGYEVERIDLFRTRLSTATRAQLNEEVVVLKWPGTTDVLVTKYRELPLGSGNKRSNSVSGIAEGENGQKAATRYQKILETIFFAHYQPGSQEVPFEREELSRTALELGIKVPLNLGDIPYSFRYRQELPESIRATAPEGKRWIIQSIGRSLYQFVLREAVDIKPNTNLVVTKVPDATPGIIRMYAQGDEQSLLAILRYNRLIDIFTGVTCYSLQNHLRTTVPNIGQVETDEIYVGVDKRGAHYIFPVQAKGRTDKIGITQIEQDFALCEDREKFKDLICRPIAAQFMADDVVALFAFVKQDEVARQVREMHFRLVPENKMSVEDLREYRTRPHEEPL